MDRITDKIANLAKALNKPVDPNGEYIDYKTLRKHYETQANQEVSQLQQRSKKPVYKPFTDVQILTLSGRLRI